MSGSAPTPVRSDGAGRVLVAYFSRAGENYYYGDRTTLTTGNTEVLARMIAGRLGCDTYRIDAAEPYSDDYDETVQRNVQEQNSDARPAIAAALPDIGSYDVVLLGSPVWNIRPPMIMQTFAQGLDFTGTTVHPFTTYAMSGLGIAMREYTDACPGAKIGEGLAVQGEKAADAADEVDAWLDRIGL